MAKRVRVVRFFNGERHEARTIGYAQTVNGIKRILTTQALLDHGWGHEVWGSTDALKTLGAKETEAGWVLVLDKYTQESVGCLPSFEQ